jgi:flagellar motor switch protein FliM
MELAQLGVPPQMLSEYLTKGTVIDLETRVSDALTLRVGHKPFMPARMVDVGGKFACQTLQGIATNITIPEGTSRLSIELAAIPVEPSLIAELAQVGAVVTTDKPIGDAVILSINQERVAEARLCVYQGRYAVEVV